MPTSRSLMLAAFAIVAGAASAVAQAPAPTPQGDSAAVVAAVERFHAALIAGDSASAVALLAPDLVVLESGSLETRAEYLGHHLGADLKAAQTSRGERTVTKATVAGELADV